MEQIFCECGEYIGVKYEETQEIELDSEVDYVKGINEVAVQCPYCDKQFKIKGRLVEI